MKLPGLCTSISKIDFVNDSENNIKKHLCNNGFWNGEILVEKKDGKKFHLQTRVNAIKDEAGKTTGFVAVISDVTHRQKRKTNLMLNRKNPSLIW